MKLLYTQRLSEKQLISLQQQLKDEKVDLFTTYAVYINGDYEYRTPLKDDLPFHSFDFSYLYRPVSRMDTGVYVSINIVAKYILKRPNSPKGWGYPKHIDFLEMYKGCDYLRLRDNDGQKYWPEKYETEFAVFDRELLFLDWHNLLFKYSDLKRIENGLVDDWELSTDVENISEIKKT